MASEDQKDCERSDNEDLTKMGKFVRFLVRIYFLPLKLGEEKTTFSFCSLPTLLNFLFYYVSSVSLMILSGVLYFSEEKRQATMKSSGSFVDILSGLSFHTTILLLFPSVPLLFGQVVIFISFCSMYPGGGSNESSQFSQRMPGRNVQTKSMIISL